MPDDSYNRLKALREVTEADNLGDAPKNAIMLYGASIEQVQAGNVLMIKTPDGEVKEWGIFDG